MKTVLRNLKRVLAFAAAILLLNFIVSAQKTVSVSPSKSPERLVHTIFTNPGEDCSTAVNISFATPHELTVFVEIEGGSEHFSYVSLGEPNDAFGENQMKANSFDQPSGRLNFDKHNVYVSGLKPDTEYEYYIVSDSLGMDVKSDPHYFHTAGRKEWSAAIIGDMNVSADSPATVKQATGMIELLDSISDGIYWVMSTGNAVSNPNDYDSWSVLSVQPVFRENMWAVANGNYQPKSGSEQTKDYYTNVLTNPLNGYDGKEGSVYWFRYGDVLFFMLDEEDLNETGSFANVSNWMEDVIDSQNSKYKIVVGQLGANPGTNGGEDSTETIDLFKKLGVDAVISGNLSEILVTDPDADTLQADSQPGDDVMKGLILDVNPDRLQLSLYDESGNPLNSYTIKGKN